MKRIPPAIIAAVGAGVIGALVMVAGMIEMNNCFEHALSIEQCLDTGLGGREVYLIVFVCAGIGGTLNAWFFGRSKGRIWSNVGFAVLGAVLATLCGGVLSGVFFEINNGVSGANVLETAILGAVFSFVFAFCTWLGAFVWIFGFTLVQLIMRKHRQLDEPTTK